jgi:hypothetical protein
MCEAVGKDPKGSGEKIFHLKTGKKSRLSKVKSL